MMYDVWMYDVCRRKLFCVRRFHGSYEAVYGGWAGNAFTALTGGISEKMKTSSVDPDEPLVTADQLFRRLNNALASGAFITATAVLPTADVRTPADSPSLISRVKVCNGTARSCDFIWTECVPMGVEVTVDSWHTLASV